MLKFRVMYLRIIVKSNFDVIVKFFVCRKDWMTILALKTFAVTIGLHYNNNHTLTALKRLTTVSTFLDLSG